MHRYIFDLDKTIWDCYSTNGQPIWAKQVEPPLTLVGSDINIAMGNNKAMCVLKKGLRLNLIRLYGRHHSIGFLSSGALENVEHNSQPSVLLLRKFGLYTMFTGDRILEHISLDKTRHLKNLAPCVFIDDNDEMLAKARAIENVKVVDAKEITDWTQILDL